MPGWILLHRTLLDWEWYDDINTRCLFIHCLLRANYSDSKWRGEDVKRGSFITSLESLSAETSLTVSQIRTAIRKLEKTGELTSKSQAKSRVVTVIKYDQYQCNDKQIDRQVTAKSQDNDKEEKNKMTSKSQAETPATTDFELVGSDANDKVNGKQVSRQKDSEIATDKEVKEVKKVNAQNKFERFWKLYPKKVDKKQASAEFMKLKPDDELFNKIISNIELRIKSGQWEDKSYIVSPLRFLKHERWNDEVTANRQKLSVSDFSISRLKQESVNRSTLVGIRCRRHIPNFDQLSNRELDFALQGCLSEVQDWQQIPPTPHEQQLMDKYGVTA